MTSNIRKVTFSKLQSDFQLLERKALDEKRFGNAVRFSLSRFADLQGVKIIEVGCGEGYASVYFAKRGASLIGFDKRSSVLLRARYFAQRWEVDEQCRFIKCFSEEIPLKKEFADIVFSKSTLQYTNRDAAIQEFLRILKPGGTLILIENLPYNPFVNLYRMYRAIKPKNKEEQKYIDSIVGYINFAEMKKIKEKLNKINCNYR